jgi:hypothetical protein
MKVFVNILMVRDGKSRLRQCLCGMAAAIASLAPVSCAKITEIVRGPGPEQVGHPSIATAPASIVTAPAPIVIAPANFDAALKENQTALAAGKIAPDIGLYNIGFIWAHPSNPKRDSSKAIHSFQTLVGEHPRSSLLEPAKTWIQVLEQQQKISEERRKLADEKRALDKEREMLAQERQKLNYASEKSRQLDLEIERRRRQTFSK